MENVIDLIGPPRLTECSGSDEDLMLLRDEGIPLLHRFGAIDDPDVRSAIVALVEALSAAVRKN